ncbi:velvet factor-domain-containing protein [Dissophora ornata]|nr:hypothetical protein BGZ58_003453 [Dissophora ornata]KAI8598560.1 velvet factor-domain-containing protein [Dissophora ornata]
MASIHDLCNPEPNEDHRRPDYPPGPGAPPPPPPSARSHPQHPAPYHHPPDPQAYPRQYAEHADYNGSPPRSHHSQSHDRHPQHHPQHYQPYPQPPPHQPYKQRSAAPPPPPHHHQHPSSSHHYHEPPYDSRHPYPPQYPINTAPSRSPPPPHAYDHYPPHPSQKGYHEHQKEPRGHSRERPRGYSSSSSRAPPAAIPIPAPTAAPSASASGPNSAGAYSEHRSIKTEQGHQETPRRSSTHQDERPAKIKIVQQPLHARMCGFGEKDRRPVDPPPIVQLLLDEEQEQHPSKRAQRSNASAAATGAKKASSSNASKTSTSKRMNRDEEHEADEDENSHGDNEEEDESYQLEEDEEEGEGGPEGRRGPTDAGRRSSVRATRGRAGSLKQEQNAAAGSSPSLGKRGRPSSGPGSSNKVKRSGSVDSDGDENSRSDHSGSDGEGQEGDDHGHDSGELREQDPLFVLHVSLWSADGKEVRNMIATPGQSDPPKLTRILMGSLVVSPIRLNNPEGVPGWYFSFPDLSIRTEGVYTLKFSLMRFGNFDFLNSEDGHATTLVAEEVSEPFTVFSAKKFPGMTESTELSKAFAKQGLKIPIRNDLRARKVDRD